MIATLPMDASLEKCLLAAKSTIRLVSCADRQIAPILRPVWADVLPAVPGSADEIPAQLDLGGPVRNTQKSNAVHASGKLFSPKNARLMGWESHLEKRAMILLECDPSVTRYCAQPMKLRYELDGQQKHYTPDTFVWRDDQLQILEVKPSATAIKQANLLRFALFERFFRAFGISFSVFDETVIDVQPRQQNCRFLLRHGRENLSPTDLYLIREGLSGARRTVRDIAGRLSGPRRLSRVYAAVLRGDALIDHRVPISEQSLLRLP